MYLGGALRRTPFFAIRRPGRNAYFYRLAGIVFGVGGRGTGWRESFFCWWAGESSRGTAKTPPLQSGNAAMAMIGTATNGHALWPYAANGVPSRGNRGRWAWTIQNDAGGTPSACRGMTTGGHLLPHHMYAGAAASLRGGAGGGDALLGGGLHGTRGLLQARRALPHGAPHPHSRNA